MMYIYITDEQDKLLCVIDIRELIQANDEDLLKDIMTKNIISLNPESTLKEASMRLHRYGYRALPIIDDQDKILGVVSYRDVVNLKHRFQE
jgi:magnesium transporter